MNHWPVRVIGAEKDGSSIFFSPTAAKAEGYRVYPLVEIDPVDIVDMLSKDFGIKVSYMYIANFEVGLNETKTYYPLDKPINFLSMHKSHFLADLTSGGYLEAIFICDNVLLLMLGGDEAWIVFDSKRYPYVLHTLEHLVEMSKNNIAILGKSDKFKKFV